LVSVNDSLASASVLKQTRSKKEKHANARFSTKTTTQVISQRKKRRVGVLSLALLQFSVIRSLRAPDIHWQGF
jgi:hypothetical protein